MSRMSVSEYCRNGGGAAWVASSLGAFEAGTDFVAVNVEPS